MGYFVEYRYNKENIPSRAYIAFKSPEKLSAFSQAYDGHTFRDKAGMLILQFLSHLHRLVVARIHNAMIYLWGSGNESYAVVEFAPCQKVPSEKKKVDPRNATIEQGMLPFTLHGLNTDHDQTRISFHSLSPSKYRQLSFLSRTL